MRRESQSWVNFMDEESLTRNIDSGVNGQFMGHI